MNKVIINSKARTALDQLRIRRTRCEDELKLIEQLISLQEKLVALEEPYVMPSVFTDANSSQHLLLAYADYPRYGSKQEKIKYLLLKANRVQRLPEIQNSIEILEGPDESKKTIISLNYIIKQLAVDGEILIGKKSNRYTFYSLPSFLEEGKLKPAHLPLAESWGSLPEKKRDVSKFKWKGGSKL